MRLDLVHEAGIELAIAHRHREAGGALEHVKVLGDLSNHRGDLDARRSGADQPDALARQFDLMLGPARGDYIVSNVGRILLGFVCN